MPSFKCEKCGQKFSSKNKKETHYRKTHGENKNPGKKSGNILGSKKLGAALIILLMVGLPLGGGMFYSSLKPDKSSGNYSYDYNPPVGYGQIPVEGEVPSSTVLSKPLSKADQVFLLAHGGSVEVNQGFKPAVLLQYNCSSCPEVSYGLEQVAREFNQNERIVYVAPYPGMDSRVAVSGLRNLTRIDEFSVEKVKNAVCGKISLPVQCVENKFGFRSESSDKTNSSDNLSENTGNRTKPESFSETESNVSEN